MDIINGNTTLYLSVEYLDEIWKIDSIEILQSWN